MTTTTLEFPPVLKEGAIIKGLPPVDSGLILQTIDNTLYLICHFHAPHPSELDCADTKTNGLKLALYIEDPIMRIAAKVGKLPWADTSMMPYPPHKDLPVTLPEKEGMPAVLLIADNLTGKICHMHVFSLSNHFSNQFLKNYHRLYKFPLAPEAYLKACATMDMLYTPQQIGTQLKQASMTISPSVKTK